jgi:hypothetical protein
MKRVPFSPPVTNRKGANFEKRFLTWVPSLTQSDPGVWCRPTVISGSRSHYCSVYAVIGVGQDMLR